MFPRHSANSLQSRPLSLQLHKEETSISGIFVTAGASKYEKELTYRIQEREANTYDAEWRRSQATTRSGEKDENLDPKEV